VKAMQRYFFDRVSETGAEFDFRGCEFANVEAAAEMAELIALDLGLDDHNEWVGWNVKVSNATGQHILTVPVRAFDAAA
jgi:hypothetical protein